MLNNLRRNEVESDGQTYAMIDGLRWSQDKEDDLAPKLSFLSFDQQLDNASRINALTCWVSSMRSMRTYRSAHAGWSRRQGSCTYTSIAISWPNTRMRPSSRSAGCAEPASGRCNWISKH